MNNKKENELIFEKYTNQVRESLKGQNMQKYYTQLEINVEDVGTVFISATVSYTESDDSDYDREYGYGKATELVITDIDIDNVEKWDESAERIIDITGTLTPMQMKKIDDAVSDQFYNDLSNGEVDDTSY